MHHTRKIFPTLAIIVAAGLSACATKYDPKSLTPVATPTTVSLHDAYTYTWELGGICTMRVQFRLHAGDYVSRVQNENGTFFEGAPGALESKMVYSTCNAANVGRGLKINADIFLPKNAQEPPRIFIREPQNGAYDITLTTLASGVEDAGVDRVATQIAVAAPGATPMAAGVGAGLGAGIVTAAIVADYGKIKIAPGQSDDSLKRALTLPR